MKMGLRRLSLILFVLLAANFAWSADSRRITYQGRIVRPDGSLINGLVPFTMRIYSPAPSSCLLWAETRDVELSLGAFSVEIGNPSYRLPGGFGGGAASFSQVFTNNPGLVIASDECASGYTDYSVGATDDRVLRVTLIDQGNAVLAFNGPIKSVPFALEAGALAGYSADYFLKSSGTTASSKSTRVFSQAGSDRLWEFAQNQDFQGLRLQNLANPTGSGDAATKDYVDNAITGSVGVTSVSGTSGQILVANGSTNAVVSLASTGVAAGSYGGVSWVPSFVVDLYGRLTSAGSTSIALDGSQIVSGTLATSVLGVVPGANGGTVVQVDTGTGLSGGGFSTSGTIYLADTSVVVGSYGSGTHVSQFTVDQQGRLTAAGSTAISISASQVSSGTLDTARLGVSGVSAGSYGSGDFVPTFNVDQYGRLTSAGSTAITSSQWSNIALGINYGSGGSVGIGVATPAVKLDVAGAIKIANDSAVCSAGFAGAIRYSGGLLQYCDGATPGWVTLGVSGSGLQSFNGLVANDQFFAVGSSGTVAAFTSSGSLHTLNIPMASTTDAVGGLLSNSEYLQLMNGTIPAARLADTSVTPGSYGSGTHISQFTVDQQGRLTAAGSVAVAIDASQIVGGTLATSVLGVVPGANGGTVVQVDTGAGLEGGPFNVSGTISLGTTGVDAGSYGSSSWLPNFVVDIYGRLTSAGSTQIAIDASQVTSGTLNSAQLGMVPTNRGGTGLDGSSASDGQLLIGNGSGYSLGTLTAGTNITITNSAGGITIASSNSGGTVTQVVAGTGLTGGTISTTGTIALSDTAVDPGTYGSADHVSWVTVNGQGRITLAGTTQIAINANQITSGTLDTARLGVSGVTAGSYGSGDFVPTFNVDQYGRLTSAGSTAITSSQWSNIALGINYGSGGSVGIGVATPTVKLDVAGAIKIANDSAVCGPSFAGAIRYSGGLLQYCDGSTPGWVSLGVSGSGLQSFNGLIANDQFFTVGSSGTLAAFTSSGSLHTLNIPMASTTDAVGGLVSHADYLTLMNGTIPAARLADTSVTPGSYGSGTHISQFTVDQQGRLTAAGSTAVAIDASQIVSGTLATSVLGVVPGANGGTVVQVDTGAGLEGGPINNHGTISLGTTGVASGSYGSASQIPTFTVDQYGRLTAAATVAVSIDASQVTSGTLDTARLGVSGVTAGSYGSGTHVPTFNVDQYGRLTSAGSTAITSSQWSNIALGINYGSGGSVGIGVATPAVKLDVAGAIKIANDSAVCGPSFAGAIRYNAGFVQYCDGSTPGWVSLGVSGSGLQSLNGLIANNQDFAVGSSGTVAAFTSSGSLHTLNIPMASTTDAVGGLLSHAEYLTLMNGTIPAARVADLDASQITSGTLNSAQLGMIPTNRGGTGLDGSTASNGQILIGNGSGYSLGTLTAGSNITITNSAGSITIASSNSGGTVVQVDTGAGLEGGPINNHGTISLGTTGVASGSYGSGSWLPTFVVDIYGRLTSAGSTQIAIDASQITSGTLALARLGTLGVAQGATGLTPSAGDANKVYGVDNSGNIAEFKEVTGGTGITVNHSAGTITISTNGMGSVTEVIAGAGLTGGTITSAGTIALPTLITAGTVGSATYIPQIGFDAFGRIVSVGSTAISLTSLDGTLGVSQGGTGLDGSTAANGALLIGNGSGFTLGTLTYSNGMVVTNSAGTINLATNAQTANVNNTIITRDGSGNFVAGAADLAGVSLRGSVTGTATLTAPSSFTNYAMTLPTDMGTPGQVLSSNGTSQLSWVSAPVNGGTILAASGSAGTPGISFLADQDTGLSNPGANTLAISTSGVERLRIDSLGNIGIGTDPVGWAKFWVNGNIGVDSAAAYLIGGNAVIDDDSGLLRFGEMGFNRVSLAAGATVGIATAGTTRLSVTDSGNIGIGTSTPNAPLEVSRDTVDILSIYRPTNTLYAAQSLGFFQNNSSSARTEYGAIAVGNSAVTAGSETSYMSFYTRNSGSYGERVRIVGSGKVGIGNSDPQTQLDINGAIRIANDAATCAAGFAGAIRYNAGVLEYCNGVGPAWLALGVSGSGLQSLNGLTANNQFFALDSSGTLAAFTSAGSLHTLNIPMGSTAGAVAGLISNADYLTLMNGTIPSSRIALGTTGVGSGTIGSSTHIPVLSYDEYGRLTSVGSSAISFSGGTFLAASGSAGTPGISFLSDPDTGLWNPGANTLAISTGGTTRVAINSLGNVGIGTLTPDSNAMLTVAAGSEPKITIRATGASSNAHIGLVGRGSSSDNEAVIYADSGGNLVLRPSAAGENLFVRNGSDSQTRFFVSGSSGRVGVGTDSPLSRLHVADGDISMDSGRALLFNSYWDGSSDRYISTDSAFQLYHETSGDTLGFYRATSGTAGNSITFLPALVMHQGGAVGIGTTAIAAGNRLEVTGGAIAAGNGGELRLYETLTNGTNSVGFRAPTAMSQNYLMTLPGTIGTPGQVLSTDGTGNLSWVSASSGITFPLLSTTLGSSGTPAYSFSGDSDTGLYSPGANTLALSTSGTARVSVASNGFVGIGTSTPATALEVAGALRLSTAGTDTYLTPAGSNVPTKINVPIYDPGNFGQIMAMGVPAIAPVTSRVVNLFDARTVPHQPTLMVLSPDESQGIGLSFDGSNTVGSIKSSVAMSFQVNGLTSATEAMRILTDGKVGIGTSVPGSLLTLRSPSGTPANISLNRANDSDQMYLTYNPNATLSPSSPMWLVGNAGSTHDFRISTYNGTVSAYPLTVQTDGKIGLGTISVSSGSQLEVYGGAITASAKGASAGDGGEVRFRELLAGGANYVAFRAPDALAANLTWQLPAVAGSSGQVLGLSGVGTLGWITAPVNGGTFLAANGSAGTPSISFSSDSDTGIYRIGANTLGFAAGGAMRMALSDQGFLGIGIEPTVFPLQIYNNGWAEFYMHNGSTGTTYADGLSLGIDPANTFAEINNHEDTPLHFSTAGGPKLIIGAGVGNISIGNGGSLATPGARLDIGGTGTLSSSILIPRDTTGNRPIGTNGMFRYNTTTNKFEGFQNGAWAPLNSGFIGKLTYAGTSNCAWTSTSASYANLAADGDCPVASVTGAATAPGTRIPGVSFSNLPPGDYEILFSTQFYQTGNGNCRWRISDGTNSAGMSVVNLNGESNNSIIGQFSYGSVQSSITFQLQAVRSGGTSTCYIANDENWFNFEVWLKRL